MEQLCNEVSQDKLVSSINTRRNMDTKIYSNIDQNIIEITEDRLRIFLTKYKECEKYHDKMTSFIGIFLSLFICIISTKEYNDLFFITKEKIEIIMISLVLISFLMMIYYIYNSLCKKHELSSIDDVINKCKNNG